MEKYFLVTYEEDYADEFYVYGMKIFTKAEYISFLNNQRYARHLERIGEIETGDWKQIELYFGTNEWLSFDSVDEIIRALNVREITEQEYKTLKNLGLDSFGEDTIFNFFESIRFRGDN